VVFSTRRAAMVGAVLALICVAAVAGAAVMGNMTTLARQDSVVDGPVVVAVVLPNADGVLTVRHIDVIRRVGETLRAVSVDPVASATVPGTSATSLADAYSFGGGEGLSAAVPGGGAGASAAWIVVGPEGFERLMARSSIQFDLKSSIEVFDGTELYSYAPGRVVVPAEQVAKLMDGVDYLVPSDRSMIRNSLGDALVPALVTGYSDAGAAIDTNLSQEQLGTLFVGVKPTPIRADTTP